MGDDRAKSQGILVVGGGLSGLIAVREAAKLGHDVTVVERAGWSRKWSRP